MYALRLVRGVRRRVFGRIYVLFEERRKARRDSHAGRARRRHRGAKRNGLHSEQRFRRDVGRRGQIFRLPRDRSQRRIVVCARKYQFSGVMGKRIDARRGVRRHRRVRREVSVRSDRARLSAHLGLHRGQGDCVARTKIGRRRARQVARCGPVRGHARADARVGQERSHRLPHPRKV